MKKPGSRQLLVLILFVAFSVGGQLIPIAVAGGQIPWHLLPMGIVPLIMTTFFEEFLFRGFVQSRAEQHFGWLPALFISGLMFSLYHLGYPGFRTLGDILLLFAVGFGFAAAYKLSGNNLFVSYFVNLPNAFVTYMLKYEQFPTMNSGSAISGIITLTLIVIVLLQYMECLQQQRIQKIERCQKRVMADRRAAGAYQPPEGGKGEVDGRGTSGYGKGCSEPKDRVYLKLKWRSYYV